MTTLAAGLPLVLAATRLPLQPYGSSTDYQVVAEPAGYFLLLAVEAEALLALLAACLLGGVVAGICWLLLAVLPFSSLPSYLLVLMANLGGHLRRPLESEVLRAG